jgi:hypothetical protein
MLKVVTLTARQLVVRYAKMHGLDTAGSSAKKGRINVIDKQGHWSEAWRLPTPETWEEAMGLLLRIERDYRTGVPRPWEVLRPTYTGKVNNPPANGQAW